MDKEVLLHLLRAIVPIIVLGGLLLFALAGCVTVFDSLGYNYTVACNQEKEIE